MENRTAATGSVASQPRILAIPEALKLAKSHQDAGRLRLAEQIYRNILAKQPNNHLAVNGLAMLAIKVGKNGQALNFMARAAKLAPNNALYHKNLGEMFRRAGKLDRALQASRRAMILQPNNAENHYHLGLVFNDRKAYKQAEQCYSKAIALRPDYSMAWNNLGAARESQGNRAGSLEAYLQAATLNPKHAEAQNNVGAIYSEQGKLSEAQARFEAAIDARPSFVEPHYNLSSLKTYTRDDRHLAMLEAVTRDADKLPVEAQIRYQFALGKALDDIGEYDRAFAAYAKGNRLQCQLQPYDESNMDALLESIQRVFTPEFCKPSQSHTDARTPIFIVGMPRSGTTLIEQILCSHPDVYGAGELPNMNQAINKVPGATAGRPFTDWAAKMTDQDFANLGQSYTDSVWRLAPDKQFISDKMPANFFYIGMIHRALPNAKFINAMRDPMDSCFSCYSRLFNQSMPFAYDLETLGRYYVRYCKLMKFWHSRLPSGAILDLPYEKMVSDQDAMTHKLLDFVGLPWNDNCMDFHKNDRLVQTASIAQVRKPIYQSSIKRWEHFANHLQPLMEVVKTYRPSQI
ncbi:MAG TPA: sulfotransferase [Pseudomonadales bacterium]|nr:sulfotransferase [Pseudomonadales bacterium]